MIDPRPGIPLIEDAYLACKGVIVPPTDDILLGTHWDGSEHIFGVVRASRLGIRGTEIFGDDLSDWVNDAIVRPSSTPWGFVATGVYDIFKSFRLQSGRKLEDLSLTCVDGHSLGAGLAAIVSVALSIPHVLWACPNWFSVQFHDAFEKQDGHVFSNAGDIVPWLPLPTPLNPRLGPITHLTPPAALNLHWHDFAGHHSFATYVAAYNAQLPQPLAA